MKGICGRTFTGSLESANLQSCLENRLQTHLASNGSIEYKLIWRKVATPLGRPLSQRLALERPMTESVFGGWGTPLARDWKDCGPSIAELPPRGILGRMAYLSSTAPTENGDALNPEFVRWLMGFPEEWTKSLPTVTRLSRK